MSYKQSKQHLFSYVNEDPSKTERAVTQIFRAVRFFIISLLALGDGFASLIFPPLVPLVPVAYFPALSTGCMFSRA